MKKMAAGLLFTITLTLSRLSGSTPLMIAPSQLRVVVERFVPKIVDQEPDSIPGWKLAPLTTAVMAGLPPIWKLTLLETLPSGFETVIEAAPPDTTELAGTLAVRLVALPNVVGIAVLLKFTVDPETKPVPVTVNVTPDEPASMEAGETLEIARSLRMLNVTPPETLASGLVTVMVALPTDVSRFAGMVAVNEVALAKFVVSFVELKFTTEPETNPEPVIVNCWSGDPLIALAGEMSAIDGFGVPAVFGVSA
jgi:hypothetical protein